MKHIITLSLLLSSLLAVSQDAEQLTDYNKWSIELSGGAHAVADNFTTGYFTDAAGFFQGTLGARYMFSNKVGAKLGFGYNKLTNDDDSLPFENEYFRVSLEGVINFGPILGLNELCKGFTVLGHGGIGYSTAKADNISFGVDENDSMGHFILGLTPQFKISERINIITDLSVLGHFSQEVTWDGQSAAEGTYVDDNQYRNNNFFASMILNASIGVSLNLGKATKHIDWKVKKDDKLRALDSLSQRIAAIEDDMIDDDKDGVPNYLDQDNRTESGVTTDNRGRAIDVNRNGIPDELEAPLDTRYSQQNTRTGSNTISTGDPIRELINNGYVNVYFTFNSSKPTYYSLSAINYLITYMLDNPTAKAELTGYADELGDANYNSTLSTLRAKRVYDILVASGVEASRLTYTGNGEDQRVDKNSSEARQLIRRVTFRLK